MLKQTLTSQPAGALDTPLRYLKGIGPKRAERLAAIGLFTVEDLLYHLPFRYEDRRHLKKIAQASAGQEETFVGRLVKIEKKFNPRRRRQLLTGTLSDGSGVMELIWFRAPGYLADRLSPGQTLLIHGKVEALTAQLRRIVHPEFEVLDASETGALEKILPVYLHPAGVPLSVMRKWTAQALLASAGALRDALPGAAMVRLGLMPASQALRQLHQPDASVDVDALNGFTTAAHRSVIFDELFYLQLGLGLRRQKQRGGAGIALPRRKTPLMAEMNRLLPFKLTGAQKRVLDEIFADLESGAVMQRLVQGDVGAGKTIVAWYASLRAIENGYQAVWMAPTELLAEQHFRSIKPYAEALRVEATLLTGSLKAKEKKAALEQTAAGQAQFIVGTHALIQQSVAIPRMALGVIDEQHRFGVVQRLALQRFTAACGNALTAAPHLLLMSATPIPRSLAMVLYGDLDVSFLDELPPGRAPAATKVYRENQRREVYELVLEQLRHGHQAFIVYPLVEASEQLKLVRDATRMAEKMRAGPFKEFGVGLVHGKMVAAERDRVMAEFRAGTMGVLVATTVIEVGIDIPNATMMVVEHAERFGLSQLHQLRGRVGRGSAPGYCLLINRAPGNILAARRLRVMENERDGFKIAEADLEIRGPGEFLGTRQSGLGDFRTANLARDARLLIEARREALAWLQEDPNLEQPRSALLKDVLMERWGQRLQLGAVG